MSDVAAAAEPSPEPHLAALLLGRAEPRHQNGQLECG
jgi:hypothetical protein